MKEHAKDKALATGRWRSFALRTTTSKVADEDSLT